MGKWIIIPATGLSVHTSDVESQGEVNTFVSLHQGQEREEHNPLLQLLHGDEMEL